MTEEQLVVQLSYRGIVLDQNVVLSMFSSGEGFVPSEKPMPVGTELAVLPADAERRTAWVVAVEEKRRWKKDLVSGMRLSFDPAAEMTLPEKVRIEAPPEPVVETAAEPAVDAMVESDTDFTAADGAQVEPEEQVTEELEEDVLTRQARASVEVPEAESEAEVEPPPEVQADPAAQPGGDEALAAAPAASDGEDSSETDGGKKPRKKRRKKRK